MTTVDLTQTGSCAIRAQDFSDRVTDHDRNLWTPGKLRHVTAACDGMVCAVTTDRQTGHTVFGTLHGVIGLRGGGDGLVVRHVTSDNETAYWTRGLGDTILPLEPRFSRGAKWAAMDSWREEKGAAIDYVRGQHQDEHPWGAWRAEPFGGFVRVRYTPGRQDPAYNEDRAHDQQKVTWWDVPLRELREEAVSAA